MLDEITWEQFQEWLAYEVVEPFGERRADWQAASVCAVVANVAAAKSGSRKRFKVSDFLLEFDEKEKALPEQGGQTWQQQKMIAKMFAAIATVEEERKQTRAKRDEQRRARNKKKRAVKPKAEIAPKRPTREQLEATRAALKRK